MDEKVLTIEEQVGKDVDVILAHYRQFADAIVAANLPEEMIGNAHLFLDTAILWVKQSGNLKIMKSKMPRPNGH